MVTIKFFTRYLTIPISLVSLAPGSFTVDAASVSAPGTAVIDSWSLSSA